MKLEKQIIKCGWGKEDITPAKKTLLRGQFYQRVSTHINDPLYATALAIQPTQGKVMFWISFDLLCCPKEIKNLLVLEIKKHILDFSEDRLICSCIHSHTGPYLSSFRFKKDSNDDSAIKMIIPEDCIVPESYVKNTLVPKATNACITAYNNLKPASFSSVLGHVVIGHCRRIKMRDGSSIMYGRSDDYNFDRLEGPSDSGVEMLYVFDTAKELQGLIINIHCPAQVLESKSYISADFIGAFRKQLTEKIGREIYVLSLIGAAGNISPRDLVRRRRGEASMYELEGAYEIGRRLVNCFEYNYDYAKNNIERDIEFGYIYKDVPLFIRTVTKTEMTLAKTQYEELVGKYKGILSDISGIDFNTLLFAKSIINRWNLQAKTTFYNAPVHAIRLSDCAFITNPFELYIEYGMRMRARSRATHTFTVQLTDDEAGYLPTPEAVLAKSYSTEIGSCLVSCEGGEMLTETSISMINSLFD
jgi:hypothetical protein